MSTEALNSISPEKNRCKSTGVEVAAGFRSGFRSTQNPTPTQAMDKAAGSQFLAESHAKSTAFSQLSMIKSSDTP